MQAQAHMRLNAAEYRFNRRATLPTSTYLISTSKFADRLGSAIDQYLALRAALTRRVRS